MQGCLFSRFRLLFREGRAYSEYQVLANIGWITALSIFTIALGSLIVLPALLLLLQSAVKRIKQNNAVVSGIRSEVPETT